MLGLPPAGGGAAQQAAAVARRSSDLDLAAVVAETPGFWSVQGAAAGVAAADRIERQQTHLPPARERLLLAARAADCCRRRVISVCIRAASSSRPQPIARHAPLDAFAAKGVVVTQYDMHFVEGPRHGQDRPARQPRAVDRAGLRDDAARAATCTFPDLQRRSQRTTQRTAKLLESGGDARLLPGRVAGDAHAAAADGRAHDGSRASRRWRWCGRGRRLIGMKDAFVRRARGLEPVDDGAPAAGRGVRRHVRHHALPGGRDPRGDGGRRSWTRPPATCCGATSKQPRSRPTTSCAPSRTRFVVQGPAPRPAAARRSSRSGRRWRGSPSYSFCKAHAVTYGRLAYRCVYLKARWPAAFLCGDAAQRGRLLRGRASTPRRPSASAPSCARRACSRADVEHAMIGQARDRGGTIRIGLAQRARTSANARSNAILVARRAGGPFRSFRRTSCSACGRQRHEAENLILVGACDAFGVTRPELLWRLQVASTPRAQKNAERAAAGWPLRSALFADAIDAARGRATRSCPPFDEKQRCRRTNCACSASRSAATRSTCSGVAASSPRSRALHPVRQDPRARRSHRARSAASRSPSAATPSATAAPPPTRARCTAAPAAACASSPSKTGPASSRRRCSRRSTNAAAAILQGRGPFVFDRQASKQRVGGGVGLRVVRRAQCGGALKTASAP